MKYKELVLQQCLGHGPPADIRDERALDVRGAASDPTHEFGDGRRAERKEGSDIGRVGFGCDWSCF